MPLFVCEICGAIENTALGYYWSARLQNVPRMCSECAPTIGKWHGRFPKEYVQDKTFAELRQLGLEDAVHKFGCKDVKSDNE